MLTLLERLEGWIVGKKLLRNGSMLNRFVSWHLVEYLEEDDSCGC